MAQSRLEKIGTIFTRVGGLLRSGAMKPEDKPIWYDVYEAFPPKAEPRFDRPASTKPIRQIFYEEDIVRAKFHKAARPNETINLIDTKRETQTRQFIKIYNNLKAQGALDDEKVFETAQDLLAEQRIQSRVQLQEPETELNLEPRSTLLTDFKEAKFEAVSNPEQPKSDETQSKASGPGINIGSIFKD